MASHVGSISSAMVFNSMRDCLPEIPPEKPSIPAKENHVTTTTIIVSEPIIIRKTDEEIELIAEAILENKMKNFQCSFDILSQIVRLEDLKPNLEQEYTEYGHKLLNYLQHHIHLELMRHILRLSAKRQLKDLRDLSASGFIAIARGGKEEELETIGKRGDREAVGKGEDREAAFYAASQCVREKIPTICVTITDGTNPALPKKPFTHTFLLLGLEKREFEMFQGHSQILEILKQLQHGVLFDPSLKLICPLTQINTRGRKFLQYIKVRGIKILQEIFTRSDDEWREILVGADRCSRAMTGEFIASELALDLASKAEKVRKWIISDTKKELNRIFPRLMWSMDVRQGEIWVEGNAPVVIQAQNNLRNLGIQANIVVKEKFKCCRKQIQFRCTVRNADLTQLRQLRSSHSYTTLYTSNSPSIHTSPLYSPMHVTTSSSVFVPALVLTPLRGSTARNSTSRRVAPLDSAPIVHTEKKEGKGII